MLVFLVSFFYNIMDKKLPDREACQKAVLATDHPTIDQMRYYQPNHAAESFSKRAAARDVVREYFHRLLNEKDLSACDELLSSDYRDHDAPPDTPPGPESTKGFVARFLEEYPNLRVDIEDLIAEENRVAARIVWHGNHRETGVEFHQVGNVFLRLDETGHIHRAVVSLRANLGSCLNELKPMEKVAYDGNQ